MAKKKQTQVAAGDAASNGEEAVETATVETVTTNGHGSTEVTAPPTQSNGNGHRRPEISWRLNSDRTTSIEVAAWLNVYKTQQGEEYEQVSFTVQRSYRDQNDVWAKGGSWRNHDLPVLVYLLQKAHGWALDRRMAVTCADTPF